MGLSGNRILCWLVGPKVTEFTEKVPYSLFRRLLRGRGKATEVAVDIL